MTTTFEPDKNFVGRDELEGEIMSLTPDERAEFLEIWKSMNEKKERA